MASVPILPASGEKDKPHIAAGTTSNLPVTRLATAAIHPESLFDWKPAESPQNLVSY